MNYFFFKNSEGWKKRTGERKADGTEPNSQALSGEVSCVVIAMGPSFV